MLLGEELAEDEDGLVVVNKLELVPMDTLELLVAKDVLKLVVVDKLELLIARFELELVIIDELRPLLTTEFVEDNAELVVKTVLELLLEIELKNNVVELITKELVEDDVELVVKGILEMLLKIELEEDVAKPVATKGTLDVLVDTKLDTLLDDKLVVPDIELAMLLDEELVVLLSNGFKELLGVELDIPFDGELDWLFDVEPVETVGPLNEELIMLLNKVLDELLGIEVDALLDDKVIWLLEIALDNEFDVLLDGKLEETATLAIEELIEELNEEVIVVKTVEEVLYGLLGNDNDDDCVLLVADALRELLVFVVLIELEVSDRAFEVKYELGEVFKNALDDPLGVVLVENTVVDDTKVEPDDELGDAVIEPDRAEGPLGDAEPDVVDEDEGDPNDDLAHVNQKSCQWNGMDARDG